MTDKKDRHMEDKIDVEAYQAHIFDLTIAYDSNPEAMAAYIEGGGELDDAMRKRLASGIRRHFPKHRGGKDTKGDVEFFAYVERWCSVEFFRRATQKFRSKNGALPTAEQLFGALPELKVRVTTEDALRHIIEIEVFGASPDTEINSLRRKYDRGRALLSAQK
jgi:hypothetical protein